MNTSTVPQIVMNGDGARARLTDPLASHLAADKSAKKLSSMQRIVLVIFGRIGGDGYGVTDSELCNYYSEHKDAEGWPDARDDTPRKRRSDLSALRVGLLRESDDTRENEYGSPETVWELA